MKTVNVNKSSFSHLVALYTVSFQICTTTIALANISSSSSLPDIRRTYLRHEPLPNRSSFFERKLQSVEFSERKLNARLIRSAFSIKYNASTMYMVKSEEKPSRNGTNHWQRPLFASTKNVHLTFDPAIYKCNEKYSSLCQNKTQIFRDKLLMEFKKSITEYTDEPNIYNVEYEHPHDMIKYNPTCMVLDAKLRVLTKNDSPFDLNKIGNLFPNRKLFGRKFLETPRSCVIVSSAGSLFQSGLGNFIGNILGYHSV